MRLFEGYEVEGRFRGVRTLFVAGKVPFEEINKILDVRHGQIYFGADGCSEVDWEAVYKCTKIIPVVTVELGQNNLPPGWRILLETYVHPVINIQKFDNHGLMEVLDAVWGDRIQLKFDSENRSYLAPLNAFVFNKKSDIQKDKELWNETSLES